jgi:hypothetical protein
MAMRTTKIVLYLTAAIIISSPLAAHAFWGNDGDRQSGLNLESGYDANTVTTITGRIVSVQIGEDRRNSQVELENNGTRSIVVLGPQRYWAENGIALKAGDTVTVRGSKAQGKDGIVYVLAQKITDTSQNSSVSLRNESGRPAWAGGGMGNGHGKMNNRPAQTPDRMGNGRMGR